MARIKGGPATLRVSGIREVSRELRNLGDKDLVKMLREVYKTAAEPIAENARIHAPVDSGALVRGIKAKGSRTSATVAVGTATRIIYAAPTHWGWPARGQAPQEFITQAMEERMDDVRDIFETEMEKLAEAASERMNGIRL